MQDTARTRKTYCLYRDCRGMTFVEFVGCLVALVGGAALGAFYLGVDMRTLAVGVLDKVEIEPPQFLLQYSNESEDVDQETTDSASSAIDSEATDSSVEEGSPIGQDEAPADADSDSAEAENDSSPPQAAPARKPSDAEIRVATRNYWDKIVACMVDEAAGRLKPVVADEELQLYDYLVQRREGHVEAKKALEALDTFAVDERLVSHGQQLIAWHNSGIKLYDRVLGLLTDGPSSQIEGPFAQSWQSASTQLRMEEKLVLDKHKAVAGYLDHNFSEDAPFVPAFQH